jgi:uncharacterized membrane protein
VEEAPMKQFYSIIALIKSILFSGFNKVKNLDGDLIADKVTSGLGSWRFIIVQSIILACWISLNVYLISIHVKAFDPYPFILLNLMLSFQAAFTGPVVLMSQNRHSIRDSKAVLADLECDIRAEKDLKEIKSTLQEIQKMIVDLS